MPTEIGRGGVRVLIWRNKTYQKFTPSARRIGNTQNRTNLTFILIFEFMISYIWSSCFQSSYIQWSHWWSRNYVHFWSTWCPRNNFVWLVFTYICFVGLVFYVWYLNLITNTGAHHDFQIMMFGLFDNCLTVVTNRYNLFILLGLLSSSLICC